MVNLLTAQASAKEKKLFYLFRLMVICLWVAFGTLQKTAIFAKYGTSYVLIGLMLVSAAVCILWDFFRIHGLFKSRYTGRYLLFIGFTCVSALCWIRYGIYSNAVIISYLIAEIFVLYQWDADRGRETIYKEFRVICMTVCFLSLILSLLSLLTYFGYINFGYLDSTGRVITQGYHPRFRRVWGVYIETNFQGFLDVAVIYMSAIFCGKSLRKSGKVFWIINLLIHFVCLVLTASRSAMIAFFGSVLAVGFFFSRNWISRNQSVVKEIGKRIAVGALALVVSFLAYQGTKLVMPILQMAAVNNMSFQFRLDAAHALDRLYMMNGLDIWGELADYVPPAEDENKDPSEEDNKVVLSKPDTIVRQDIEAKEDYSNGRLHVWIDSIKLIFRFPIAGMSPGNRTEIVNAQEIDVCREIKLGWTLLNGYLEVLVGSGLVGFALLCWFLFGCVSRLWKYDRSYGKYQLEIGCALGIIIGEMICALFLSELFYTKSIHTYLFWVVLGYAMALIRIEEKEQCENADHAFICDTPLQVLNAVSMVASDADGSAENSDLFVYHQFKNSHEIAEQVRKTGLFRNVYDFEPFPAKSGILSKVTTFGRILAPRYAVGRQFCGKERGYEKREYGTLALSFFTPFSDAVHLALDAPRTIQFDDGTSSYITGDLETRYRSRTYEVYNRFIACGKLSYHPEQMYLSNPDLCLVDTIPLKAFQGIGENENLRQIARDIFGYRESAYQKDSVVYLTQPMGTAEGGQPVLEREQEYLTLIRELDPIVRIHPRQTEEAFSGLTIDRVGNMWELECAECIGDSNVLIGAFSTAQLIPKMLFDREPTMIFLYQLYGARFDQADKLVERMKASYRNPEKVHVPKTREELEAILGAL